MLKPLHVQIKRPQGKRLPFTTPGKSLSATPAKVEEIQPVLLPSGASGKRRVRPAEDDLPVTADFTSGVKRARLCSEFASGTVLGPSPHPTMLEKIVREHLRHQHQTCRNPVTTPAPFALLDQHRKHSCPEAKPVSASKDPAKRLVNRALLPPFGGPRGRQLTTRNVHAKAKWTRNYLLGPDLDFRFTTQAFRILGGNDDQLVMGTSNGLVHRYNAWTSEYIGAWDLSTTLENTEDYVQEEDFSLCGLGFSSNGSHFVTGLKGSRSAVVWRVLDENDALISFRLKDARHPVLNADGDTLAAFVRNASNGPTGVGSSFSSPTTSSGIALYSLETGDQVVRFLPTQGYISNGYTHTNICMSPGGMLVCYDGVLWDARRSPRPIHKFDKLSDFGWGSLHPSGLQLLLNKDVWDLRTYRIVQSCSNALNGSTFRFDPFGDVIYSFQDATKHRNKFGDRRSSFRSSVVVTDGTDYTNIASLNIDRDIHDLVIHPSGGHFGVIVSTTGDNIQTEGRLYEIGRGIPDEDDSDINEPIEEEGDNSGSEEDQSEDEDDDIDGDDDFDENDEIVLGDLAGNHNFGDAILQAISMMQHQGNAGDEDQDGDDGSYDEYEESEGDDGDGFMEVDYDEDDEEEYGF